MNNQLKALLPTISKVINKTIKREVTAKGITFSPNDKSLKVIFQKAYAFLPGPVSILISEELFVKFCMTNKALLVKGLAKSTSKSKTTTRKKTSSASSRTKSKTTARKKTSSTSSRTKSKTTARKKTSSTSSRTKSKTTARKKTSSASSRTKPKTTARKKTSSASRSRTTARRTTRKKAS